MPEMPGIPTTSKSWYTDEYNWGRYVGFGKLGGVRESHVTTCECVCGECGGMLCAG